ASDRGHRTRLTGASQHQNSGSRAAVYFENVAAHQRDRRGHPFESSSIALLAAARDRLARCETFVHAVPEGDGRIVHLPAEIDELAVAERRKIDKPEVEIFDDAAVLLDGLDEFEHFFLHGLG